MNYAALILIFLALVTAPAQQAFDLQAELGALTPGAVLTIPPGVYTGMFVADASCTPAQPCRIEAAGAVIDGGLRINGTDQEWRGLEVRNTTWATRVLTTTTAPQPIGIEVLGARTKIANCDVHDTNGGVYVWSSAVDSEVAGCRIANVGFRGSDRGHGHGIYTQSAQGVTRFHDNVILPGYSGWGIHAYGQAGKLEGFAFARNVHVGQTWLVGGGQPVDRTVLDENVVWDGALDLGYWGATHNRAITVTNNLLATTLLISGFQSAHVAGNTFARMSDQARVYAPGAYAWDQNTYLCPYTTCLNFTAGGTRINAPTWQTQTGYDAQSSFVYGATLNRVIVWPGAGRSIVIIINGTNAASVPTPVAGRYVNAQNVAESITLAKGAALPMTGWTVAAPYGAPAPLRAWDSRFSVWMVEPCSSC